MRIGAAAAPDVRCGGISGAKVRREDAGLLGGRSKRPTVQRGTGVLVAFTVRLNPWRESARSSSPQRSTAILAATISGGRSWLNR